MFIKKQFGRVAGKRRAIFKAVGVAAAATVFCVGCGNSDYSGGGKYYDGSDDGGGGNELYIYTGKKVVIGGKTWMSENANYKGVEPDTIGKCYNDSADNCAKYGRLYTWAEAKSACPSGWRLPKKAEWDSLMTAVGGLDVAGTKLKSQNGWNNNGNGTDDYGFLALPGGIGNNDGSSRYAFHDAGNIGFWWSATEDVAYNAWRWNMSDKSERVNSSSQDKADLLSVRCVQD